MHPPTRFSRLAKPFVVVSTATLLLIGCTNEGESPARQMTPGPPST